MPVGLPKFLGGSGLQRVFNNSELVELSRREEEARRGPPEPILQLAAHIRKAFEAAVNHRQSAGVTERLLRCQRQRMGVYEPEKAQAIREQGGSDLYFNLTETKCSAAEAWISDVLSPAGDKPWTLEPTPIADLGEALKQQLIERVMMEFQAQLGGGECEAGAPDSAFGKPSAPNILPMPSKRHNSANHSA